MFYGSMTAIITPFRDGDVDWKAFDNLLEWQIAEGTHGLVVCGTTGESPTLTDEEHKKIVERSVKLVKGRIPVIAGTGSNSTAKTIKTSQHAKEAGVDGVLIVTPYYNKPTQDGLYAHYSAIASAVDTPIVIYNIPGRSVIDMKPETIGRVARDHKNIVGVKDATSDISRVKATAAAVGREFDQLSGEDGVIYDFLEAGGVGCISVTSNVAPAACAALHNAWRADKKDEARKINERLMPLHKNLFVETSPAPVKYACARLGLCANELRLPMIPASSNARKAVDEAMQQAGIAAVQAAA